jgi:sporulation protein YlmC with PRC-barrel domain
MPQQLDAALRLLDRQLVDKHGRLAGKVDDLELTDPGGNLEQPYVTAILTGPGALAGRLHIPLGRWLQAISTRLLLPGRQGPSRVPFQQVQEIGSAIRLRLAADQLAGDAGEAWVRQQLIGKLPGAGHAAE